jgi:tRNA (cytidine(34)-2'-O)-methyltransferase
MTHDSADNTPMFHIILVEPEIPPNTGNAIRLAANTGCTLHLVEPLGFSMEDRLMRRAGLDYHEYARVLRHRDWASLLATHHPDPQRMFALTTKGHAWCTKRTLSPATGLCLVPNRAAWTLRCARPLPQRSNCACPC